MSDDIVGIKHLNQARAFDDSKSDINIFVRVDVDEVLVVDIYLLYPVVDCHHLSELDLAATWPHIYW